jgi:hypothetical protein
MVALIYNSEFCEEIIDQFDGKFYLYFQFEEEEAAD